MGLTYAGGSAGWRKAACSGAALLVLAGCQAFEGGNPFKSKPEVAAISGDTSSARLVEVDVEAPEVFQLADKGLWDGRPSLGGVWVAHPDVKDPERVIITNTTNSKSVIGALFRRERANPGPVFQVSSDAAAALGMLAGAPAGLRVTALRREKAPTSDAAVDTPEPTSVDLPNADTAADDYATETAAATLPASAPALTPKPASSASGLNRPYPQIGISSVKENADSAATLMRQAGMAPSVLEQESQGGTVWRVAVGPAATASGRDTLASEIRSADIGDAYAVSN